MYLLKTMVLELRVIHVLRNSKHLLLPLVERPNLRNVHGWVKGGRLLGLLERLWVYSG
jgi:hypothetical protein